MMTDNKSQDRLLELARENEKLRAELAQAKDELSRRLQTVELAREAHDRLKAQLDAARAHVAALLAALEVVERTPAAYDGEFDPQLEPIHVDNSAYLSLMATVRAARAWLETKSETT